MPEFRVTSGYSVGVVEARTAELAAVDFASRHPPKSSGGGVEVRELGPVQTFYLKQTISVIKK